MIEVICHQNTIIEKTILDCSQKFAIVIVYRKKQHSEWRRIFTPSVYMNFTGQFLMYVSDAVWYIERSAEWKTKLLNFLIISQNESEEDDDDSFRYYRMK